VKANMKTFSMVKFQLSVRHERYMQGTEAVRNYLSCNIWWLIICLCIKKTISIVTWSMFFLLCYWQVKHWGCYLHILLSSSSSLLIILEWSFVSKYENVKEIVVIELVSLHIQDRKQVCDNLLSITLQDMGNRDQPNTIHKALKQRAIMCKS
jgi:hypothetical protein